MTSNHVGELCIEGRTGFGLGFEVVEHLGRADRRGSTGEAGWGEDYCTTCWANPKEELTARFMARLLPRGDNDLHPEFSALLYQALFGPPQGRNGPCARR